jgi:hypothetical protein
MSAGLLDCFPMEDSPVVGQLSEKYQKNLAQETFLFFGF